MGLIERRAAYVEYAQAVPLKYAIDGDNCIWLIKGKCGACKKLCPADAVDFDQKPFSETLNVGAVVLANGFTPFEPDRFDNYQYANLPNVVTSMEFERILSASGPYDGHIVRPSDHQPPKKIAWIQCVGSRDIHPGAGKYCSTVCCTYAIKEAIIAKEHIRELDAAIFYIDIRTQGKGFETYYTRARDEAGVRFIKSRIASVARTEEEMLRISYTDPGGSLHKEDFDIVVLSVGMRPSGDAVNLSEIMGIDLDDDGFPRTESFFPINTTQPNIYVCGAAHAPKDIPLSVINASASAGAVAAALTDNRWSQHKTREEAEEVDVKGLAPRIGVFVCHCGTNIAGVVDVAAVADYAKTLPYVVYSATNLYSCSQDNQVALAEIIKKHQLNRVVVAACTPRTHEPVFQETLKSAGLNKYLIEMANIRNHCSWVHASQPELATEKSKDLVRMAVEKITLTQPLSEEQIEINQDALVIGGGLAGLTAAKNLAQQGFTTYLVEKSDRLGGQANHVLETWMGEDMAMNLDRLIREVEAEKLVRIYLDSEINEVEGSMGRFKTIITSAGEKVQLFHGAAIIATGGVEYKPEAYLYGADYRVMTALDLDRALKRQDNEVAKCHSVAFLQCVGSRIPERPYCSRVCCTHSVKSALRLKAINPAMEIYIVYRHIRTYGLRENLYRQAREQGIHFLRYGLEGGVEVKEDQGHLQITFLDTTLNRRVSLTPERLILAAATTPPGNDPIAKAFKVPLNTNGFFSEAHIKLRPVDFATDGVFCCGLAHGPKPVDEAVAQAQAAAARAANVLNKPVIRVGGKTARIDQGQCTGCCVCEEVCPFHAITLNNSMLAEVNPALCKGCGLCAASCRSGAALLDGFSDAEIFAQVGTY